MLRFIIGFGLIGVAVATLITILASGTSIAPVKQVMNSLYCQTGETITQQSTRSYGNTYNITYACVNAQEIRRDVTGEVVMSMIGVFVTLLFLGITFIISGARGMVRSRIQRSIGGAIGFGQPYTNTRTVITLDGKTVQGGSLSPQTQQQIQNALDMVGIKMDEMGHSNVIGGANLTGNTPNDLTSRLKQLQEARDAGLISETEYNRLRQEILDSLA